MSPSSSAPSSACSRGKRQSPPSGHVSGSRPAEPPARRDAAVGSAPRGSTGDARDRGAVHHDAHRHAHLRADPVPARAPAPGLRVLHAGVRPRPAAADAADHLRQSRCCSRPESRSATSSSSPRRCTSSRTSTAVSSTSSSRRASTTSSPPRPCWRWGCCSRYRWRSSPSPAPGLVTPKQLRHNRRYAVLACGLVAAVLPGDAITMLLETLPLYLLFEAQRARSEHRRRSYQRPHGPTRGRRGRGSQRRPAMTSSNTSIGQSCGKPASDEVHIATMGPTLGVPKGASPNDAYQSRSSRYRRRDPRSG